MGGYRPSEDATRAILPLSTIDSVRWRLCRRLLSAMSSTRQGLTARNAESPRPRRQQNHGNRIIWPPRIPGTPGARPSRLSSGLAVADPQRLGKRADPTPWRALPRPAHGLPVPAVRPVVSGDQAGAGSLKRANCSNLTPNLAENRRKRLFLNRGVFRGKHPSSWGSSLGRCS